MLSSLPSRSIEGGIDLLNRFAWNISVEQRGEEWLVFGGDKLLLRTDSRSAVDSFLYGLSLAYALLPDEVAAALESFVRDATG